MQHGQRVVVDGLPGRGAIRVGQSRVGQSRVGQSRVGQGRVGQGRVGQDRVGHAARPLYVIGRVGARRLHRLAPVGFRAPLSEPGVHLSLCTGLSIDVDAKSEIATSRIQLPCSIKSQLLSELVATYCGFRRIVITKIDA